MAKTSKDRTGERYQSILATRLRLLLDGTPNATQTQLSEAIGVSQQMVSQYANGVSEPGCNTLVKIADYFDVSIDYLLGRSEAKTTDISIQAACKTTGLTEESVKLLHEYVNMPKPCDGDSGNEHYYYNAHFLFDLVNEFIDFILTYSSSKSGLSFKDYVTFRQSYSAYQQDKNKAHDMTSQELFEDVMDRKEILELASRRGFHPLFSEESVNYFLTLYCDQYKRYLELKYPVDRRPITPTIFSAIISEDQNGND